MSANDPSPNPVPPRKKLTPEAERALAEAQARRAAQAAAGSPEAGGQERGGRGGLEPTRYGDWEIKGLTADF